MKPNDYQRDCLRTWSGMAGHEGMTNAVLGMAGEAGEVADLYKKYLFHGKDVSEDDFINEVGDVLYYCAVFASLVGCTLEDIMRANIDKLRRRYPDGFVTGGGNRSE